MGRVDFVWGLVGHSLHSTIAADIEHRVVSIDGSQTIFVYIVCSMSDNTNCHSQEAHPSNLHVCTGAGSAICASLMA